MFKIKFDFLSYKDTNGFIRLSNVPYVDKFIKLFKNKSTIFPINPMNSLYKDYTCKVISYDAEYDFREVCQAEKFFERIATNLPTGWVMWSTIDNQYTESYRYRRNTIFNIQQYKYENSAHAYQQTVKILWTDFYGNSGITRINVLDINSIVFKIMSEDEITKYKEYMEFISQKPLPEYRLFEMKQIYKDDYNIYLSDCDKYGFKPLEETLIKHINLEYKGIPTTFTPEGCLGWNPDDDSIVVNKN